MAAVVAVDVDVVVRIEAFEADRKGIADDPPSFASAAVDMAVAVAVVVTVAAVVALTVASAGYAGSLVCPRGGRSINHGSHAQLDHPLG